jgi:pyruvate dehydrogenase E1 component alpha subunit
MYDPDLYRDREEIEQWKARDPIKLLCARLEAQGALGADGLGAFERKADAVIGAAVAEADEGPLEPVTGLLEDVYTRPG